MPRNYGRSPSPANGGTGDVYITQELISGITFVNADATAGEIELTLPAEASNTNSTYTILKVDTTTNKVIIKNSAGTIKYVLSQQYQVCAITSDGTTWNLVSSIPIYYDASRFGAIGNNSTPANTAIQGAIDEAIANGGGIVFLPLGTFVLEASLELADNITLMGCGAGTILTSTGSIGSVIKSKNSATRYNFWKIQNLRINAYTGDIGINMYNISRSRVEDVIIVPAAGTIARGISIETGPGGGAYYNKINRCMITTCTYGIYNKDGNATDISCCDISTCTSNIYLYSVAGANIIGGTIELFTTGIEIVASGGICVWGTYIEGTAPITNTGIKLDPSCVWIKIYRPRWGNVGYTNFDPNGCPEANYSLDDHVMSDTITKTRELRLYDGLETARLSLTADQYTLYIKEPTYGTFRNAYMYKARIYFSNIAYPSTYYTELSTDADGDFKISPYKNMVYIQPVTSLSRTPVDTLTVYSQSIGVKATMTGTVFTATRCTGSSPSGAEVGDKASASGGSYGVVTVVGADYVDVTSWVGGTPADGEVVTIYEGENFVGSVGVSGASSYIATAWQSQLLSRFDLMAGDQIGAAIAGVAQGTSYPYQMRLAFLTREGVAAATEKATLTMVGKFGVGLNAPVRKLESLDDTYPQLRLTHTSASIYTDFQTDANGDLTITPSGDEIFVPFGKMVVIPNVGLHVLDTDHSHDLIIKPGSDLTADKTLTLTTGDADRTITLSGNPTLNDWFDQSVKTTATPEFAGLKINGSAYFDAEVDNGDSGAADTIDWTAGNKQKSTLTAACVFTFTAPAGPCNVILKLVQGGAGSFLVTWPATVKWPTAGTAPTLSTAVGAIDVVAFYYDGTNYYGTSALDFQ